MQATHDHTHHDHSHSPPARGPQIARAALIGGTGLMLLYKVGSGTLPFYVHTNYTPLIAFTGIALLLLALLQLWLTFRPVAGMDEHDDHSHDHDGHDHHDHDHSHDDDGHDHAPLGWRSPALLALVVPVVLGLLVPARALGGAAIDAGGFANQGQGIRTVQTIVGEGSAVDTSQWTLLDYVNALTYNPDHPTLQGKPIETIGFVWRNDELPQDQFFVARFVMSCCTADGLAIYLPVNYAGATDLPADSWVRVRGTIGLDEVQGAPAAVIEATEIIPMSQPAQPYLYP